MGRKQNAYEPTAEDIKRECARFQAGWNRTQKFHRMGKRSSRCYLSEDVSPPRVFRLFFHGVHLTEKDFYDE